MDNRITCAIHQPNLFPRLSTLAKLYAADVWIVLDDIQFNHRDYQHRARLAALENVQRQQWLSLPVHKPFGRLTLVNEVLLHEPDKSACRVVQLAQQYFGRAPYWTEVRGVVQEVAAAITVSARLADVTEISTRVLLSQLGWRGTVVRSSTLVARPDRSARLADLALAVRAGEYLCGTGGAKYIDEAPFRAYGISVRYCRLPEHQSWQASSRVSALRWIAGFEPASLGDALQVDFAVDEGGGIDQLDERQHPEVAGVLPPTSMFPSPNSGRITNLITPPLVPALLSRSSTNVGGGDAAGRRAAMPQQGTRLGDS